MQQLSGIYCEETEKSFRQVIDDIDYKENEQMKDAYEKGEDFARFLGMPITHDDINYIEHRNYHDYIS